MVLSKNEVLKSLATYNDAVNLLAKLYLKSAYIIYFYIDWTIFKCQLSATN